MYLFINIYPSITRRQIIRDVICRLNQYQQLLNAWIMVNIYLDILKYCLYMK